ncbi:hypothetical protein ACCO45_010382 [Purpureocillium lilacinum]|uniref:Uncharacterized protein n=1 Tax=Purpureocillium lilacinum TaxID=33203 RepID=A0ACC4DG55_PURLI
MAAAAARFVPRDSFAIPSSIPKTYFLGHHAAGASKIKGLLSTISLVLECRDFRLPLSTHNPTLERAVAGRERLNRPATTDALLARLRDMAREQDSLTGLRALVVGMPNVGKSTLLNALRTAGAPPGQRRAKAARTGDQAGVTRRVGTAVRVVDSEDRSAGGVAGGVYVLDTPGIFQPYVDDGETMVKVALAHGIKKGLIPDEILADYLLYRMNRWDPCLYARYCEPTNDVNEFLDAVARRDGKLKTGGLPNWQEAAARVLSQWREGKLGRYVLDDLDDAHLRAHELMLQEPQLSLNQARKLQKEERKREKTR